MRPTYMGGVGGGQSTPPSLPVQMLISSRNTLTEILNNVWPNIWAPVVQASWHIKLTVMARISPVGPEDSIWGPRWEQLAVVYWSFSLHPSLPNISHSLAPVWLAFVLPRWLRTLGPLISKTNIGQFFDNHDIFWEHTPFCSPVCW